MAGYASTPLIQKLGIKENFKIAIIHAPGDFEKMLGPLPENVSMSQKLKRDLDFIHFFTKSEDELEIEISRLKKALAQNGMIWVSWPKKASKIPTDVTEDVVRAIALRNGLVDVKVCAVDEIWSGLKLVIPVKNRK